MFYLDNASWIPFAPALPAPIARITVAAPVTASPPANTNALEVCPLSSSATMHLLLFVSRPFVVEAISGIQESQLDVFFRMHQAHQVPSSQLSYLSPNRSHQRESLSDW